jgi:hypothetical protein
VLSLLEEYFDSDDLWILQNSGYTFTVFYGQVNKLIAQRAARNSCGY